MVVNVESLFTSELSILLIWYVEQWLNDIVRCIHIIKAGWDDFLVILKMNWSVKCS